MKERIDLVMPAAGLGTRLGHALPKQYVHLAGVPLLIHPLRVYAQIPWIGQRIVVHDAGHRDLLESILKEHGIEPVVLVEGGSTRQESIRRGLAQVTTRRVITHNAAVALVNRSLIDQVAAHEADCVTTSTPVQDNMVYGHDWAERPVSRQGLCVVNSPQCFVTSVLRDCHARAQLEGVTVQSDAELMLHYGRQIRLVPGDTTTFKITTPLDLLRAEALLAQSTRPS